MNKNSNLATVKPALNLVTTCIQRPPLFKDHLIGHVPIVALPCILTSIERPLSFGPSVFHCALLPLGLAC